MNHIAREIWDWIKTFVVVIVIVLIVRTFFFANYMVHGESMMPTIENGERLIINKIGYEFSEPERFDLIVFHANEESDYIKRVIGLPGDHIEYRDDVLYINGEAYEEEYLSPYREQNERGLFTNDFTLEKVTGYSEVPEGKVFVLGDNRQNSMDSRQIGLVEMEEIVGKANIRYWPVNEFTIIQ
ncbi:signal peptidase I [Alteribacillus iranensis]|uniref:Signal peptidase I n=1 Tax=Alteribacillus iranensis TaxID=930128 RepID=A0A1I2FKX7_9BACI|nr:signal peptidase I [Alteribacillus iranensis]SFF06134.1 signal peptidase I [Alteribacillus iranensis]